MTFIVMTFTVTSIRYSLAPSAVDALGLDAEEACEVYAQALQEQHPSAVIEVTPSRTDESRAEYEGLVDDDLFTATQRNGRFSVGAVPDGLSGSEVRRIEDSLRRADAGAWERAVALAAAALESDADADDAPMILRGSVLTAVEDIDADEVRDAVENALLDDEAREYAHGRADDAREFLALYATKFRELHGEWPAF